MTQAYRLPPVSILPETDARFLAAARDIAILSDGLLMMADSPLLAVTASSDLNADDGDGPTFWCQRLEPCIERRAYVIENPAFRPVLKGLHLAAAALFERLETWGWDRAEAGALCVVTDGTGVALTRRPTKDAGPAWLLSLVEGDDPAVPVLPFGASGVWNLLLRANETVAH